VKDANKIREFIAAARAAAALDLPRESIV